MCEQTRLQLVHELLCYLVDLELDHAVRVHCQRLGLMHRRVANHQGNLQATSPPSVQWCKWHHPSSLITTWRTLSVL